MRATPYAALLAAILTCAGPATQPRGAAGPTAAPRYAALFVRVHCNDCHAVSALGVRAATDVGPDLTTAYADVVTRYGMNLETFLAHPTGVMRLMLVAHLDLTQADRDSIVYVLRLLHQQRRAELSDAPPRLGRLRP
jgi:mono/diheme cytochrome c family protein